MKRTPLQRRTPLRRRPFTRAGMDQLVASLPRVRLATPSWADQDAIREVYREARELQALTDQPHQVDHIIPLQHPLVCGLHVADNLRAVPSWFNMEKGNRWRP